MKGEKKEKLCMYCKIENGRNWMCLSDTKEKEKKTQL